MFFSLGGGTVPPRLENGSGSDYSLDDEFMDEKWGRGYKENWLNRYRVYSSNGLALLATLFS